MCVPALNREIWYGNVSMDVWNPPTMRFSKAAAREFGSGRAFVTVMMAKITHNRFKCIFFDTEVENK